MEKQVSVMERTSYPVLMKSKDSDIVILAFDGEYGVMEGIVLITNNPDTFSVGEYSADWDKECFEEYDGEVILKNSNEEKQ